MLGRAGRLSSEASSANRVSAGDNGQSYSCLLQAIITSYGHNRCLHGSGSVQARQSRENGNSVDEYRSLFKATSIMMQTIPKHASFKEPRWQKLHSELSKSLKDDVVRLEELKTLINAGTVTVVRTIKPGAVRMQADRMPSVDWAQHTPTVAGTTHMPPHYWVNNPTVERIASQPTGPVAHAADPNDPFAASAAFSNLSLAPGAPPPPPPPTGLPYTGASTTQTQPCMSTLQFWLLFLRLVNAPTLLPRSHCCCHAQYCICYAYHLVRH